MTNQAFIDELSRRLRDDNPDKDCRHWDEGFLTKALNAAFGALCHVKPEAFVEFRDLTLVPGHEQTIDDDLHQIVEILHNVCPNTGAAKRAITKADRSTLDAAYPHWRQDKPRNYIRHFLRNDILDSKFDVWPPVAPTSDDTPATIIRGTFTKTPCIVEGAPTVSCGPMPEVPPLPVEPVNPGEVGDNRDVAPDGLFGATVFNANGPTFFYSNLYHEELDAYTQGNIIDVEFDDLGDASGIVRIGDRVFTTPNTSFTAFTSQIDTDAAGTDLRYEDLTQVETVRLIATAGNQFDLVGFDLRNEGVTQSDVDQYNADLAQYEIDLAEHTEASEALAEWTACMAEGVPAVVPTRGLRPFVPPMPVRPTDPGEIGAGAEEFFIGTLTNRVALAIANPNFDGFLLDLPRADIDLALAENRALQTPSSSISNSGDNYTFGQGDTFKVTFNEAPFAGWNVGLTGQLRMSRFTTISGPSGLQMERVWEDEAETIPVLYNDPRIAVGNTVQFRDIGTGNYLILPDEPDVEGTNQQQIDQFIADEAQYLIDLEEFNIARQAFAEWLALDPDYVAQEPVLPVNPGNVGDGADVAPDGFFGPDSMAVERLTGRTIDIVVPDLTNLSGAASFNLFIYPNYPGFGGQIIRIHASPTDTTDLQWSDFTEGDVVRLNIPSDFEGVLIGVNDFSEGITQAQVDEYLAALDQYNFDLLVYNTFLNIQQTMEVAAIESNANQLFLSDPFPFDKAYHLPISEFALYYCYAVDDDVTANSGRAQRHWLAFFQLMNKREDADLKIMTYQDETE